MSHANHAVSPPLFLYAEAVQFSFNPKKRRKIMSSEVLKRDVTGKCEEGECRDRVTEGNKDRQAEIEKEGVKAPESYPPVPGAEKLDNPDNPAAGIPGRGK
jgi:hypothetical protein